MCLSILIRKSVRPRVTIKFRCNECTIAERTQLDFVIDEFPRGFHFTVIRYNGVSLRTRGSICVSIQVFLYSRRVRQMLVEEIGNVLYNKSFRTHSKIFDISLPAFCILHSDFLVQHPVFWLPGRGINIDTDTDTDIDICVDGTNEEMLIDKRNANKSS